MLAWDRAFTNNNVNAAVDICTKTIQNILSNFIFHETITTDKDPPWFILKLNLYFNRKLKFTNISAKP